MLMKWELWLFLFLTGIATSLIHSACLRLSSWTEKYCKFFSACTVINLFKENEKNVKIITNIDMFKVYPEKVADVKLLTKLFVISFQVSI